MSKWMRPLQTILLGAKILGFTDAPWAQIFIPTIYIFVIGYRTTPADFFCKDGEPKDGEPYGPEEEENDD